MLLAFSFSNAFFSEMSTRCSGLYLVDQKDGLLKGTGCQTEEKLSVHDWLIKASVGKFHSEGLFQYNHKNKLYAWTLSSENDLQLNQVSIEKNFSNISYGLDLNSVPYYRARVAAHAIDSLIYGEASIAFSNPQLLNIDWNSASNLSIVPHLNANWKDSLYLQTFLLGTKFKSFNAEVGFNYGWSTPDAAERYGYLISDSSRFWGISPKLNYQLHSNTFEIGYTYEYADIYLMGLLREKDNEKRFFFLPIGIDVNHVYARYNRFLFKKDYLTAAILYDKIFLKIPWEKRRFYETFAPNRALTRSIIKTLSFATYTRNFRAGGSGDADAITAEIGYQWNRPLDNVVLKPAISVDFAFGSAQGEIYIQKESQGLLWVDKELDSLGREFKIAGALVNADFAIESSKGNLFAKLGIGQIVPFYFNKTKKRKAKEEEPIKPPPDNGNSGGGTTPPPTNPSQPTTPDDNKDEIPEEPSRTSHHKSLGDYFSDISKYAFTNGFSIQLEVGIRF